MSKTGQVREKLARLSALDRDCRAFGADAHCYRLNDPLSDASVDSFEAQHGVTLPEGYKRFLLEVADGLAGPDYGLLPLEKSSVLGPVRLSSPTEIPDSQPEYQEVDDDSEFASQDKRLFQLGGQLLLGGSGCGGVNLLILTGPERGRVWRNERAFGTFYSSGKDFLAWYETWVDTWLSPGTLDNWITRTSRNGRISRST